MSETILNEEIRDTSTYSSVDASGAIAGTKLYHVVNDLDREVTVTFYGTRHEDSPSFSDGEQIGQLTIGADSSDYETLLDPWEKVQIEVVATNSPTTDDITVYRME